MDYYNHTNNTAYAKFTADAIIAALGKGAFDFPVIEDVQARTKQISQLFRKDSAAGDRLNAEVWSEEKSINCIIKSEEGVDIYHQSLEVD